MTKKLLDLFKKEDTRLTVLERPDPVVIPVGSITDFIPKKFVQKTVRDLKEGEGGYTVPWAVSVDSLGKMSIVGSYSIHERPMGTVHMRVAMHGGIIYVDQRTVGDHRWVPTDQPCYMGVSNKDFIPVKFVDVY